MLKLTDSTSWSQSAATLASAVSRGQRVAVRVPAQREQLVARVHEALPSAIHVFVPQGADQSERVLLGLGMALGADAPTAIDHHLQTSPDQLTPLLTTLAQRIGRRPLIVNGWDALDSAGVAPELGLALAPRTHALRSWLAERSGLFVCHRWTPTQARLRRPPQGPPVQLVNGSVQDTQPLWQQVGRDEATYALVLTAVALGATLQEVQGRSGPALYSVICDLLPRPLMLALQRLAVHARPLPRQHLPPSLDDNTFKLGADLGLWHQLDDDVMCSSGWSDFMRTERPRESLRSTHLDLANAFLSDFRMDDPSAPQAGLSILEAHRNLVAAGEYDRARACWRYGAPLLIQAARLQSQAKEYDRAATLYGQVVQAVDDGQLVLPQRLRAYARHYLHFNRAHGQLERFPATERGYRKALADWPENALFWSRLVRVVCLQDRAGAALGDLDRAQQVVPEHSQKQAILIARTVRGLVDHDRLLDAVRVWGAHAPQTTAAHDVEHRLEDRLAQGWHTDRIVVNADQPLVFTGPQLVVVVRGSRQWSAELPSVRAFGLGDSPLAALQAVVETVRGDVQCLVQAYTPDLPPTDRLRKRLLLGAVDLLASRVDGPRLASWWVFGSLHRADDDGLWLRTGGGRDLWFQVPAALADTLTVDDLPHLACVATDDQGVPTGPVLELEPGFPGSEDDLWDAWRRMLDRAG